MVWVFERDAAAANSRADAKGAKVLAQRPQQTPAPKMAMSVEQPLTAEAP